ncbi:MAG: hypothetical protein WAV73_02605 [Candidatus Moraniibacteriota bacterium]
MKKLTLLFLALVFFLPVASHAYGSAYGSSYSRTYTPSYTRTYTPSYNSSSYWRDNIDRQNRLNQESLKRSMDELSRRNQQTLNDSYKRRNESIKRSNAAMEESLRRSRASRLYSANAPHKISSDDYFIDDSEIRFLEGKVKTFCSVTGSVKKCQRYCEKLTDMDKGNKLCQGNPAAKVANP